MRVVVGGKAVGRVWCERGALAGGLLALGEGVHSGQGVVAQRVRRGARVRVGARVQGASPTHTRVVMAVLMTFLA